MKPINHFIELSDDGGVFSVVAVELDGYTRIHSSLLKELLKETPYTYEETHVDA